MAEADPTGLVVCDAGPLIHLDQLGCLRSRKVETALPDAAALVARYDEE